MSAVRSPSPMALDQVATLVERGLRTSVRVPQLLMLSLTMPLAMLFLFSQVFRGIADNPSFATNVSYIDFMAPAMLAVSTVMAGTNAGVAAALDHSSGMGDRLGALPMRSWIPAAARTCTESVFTVARIAVLGVGAIALGFRFHGGPFDAVAALVVLVMLAASMSAMFGVIGERLRQPDVVQFAGMMIMMPFMFISSAFAPMETMPRWMRAAAELNPVAHAIDAVRGYALGQGSVATTLTALGVAIGWGAAALLVRPLAVGRSGRS